MSRTKADPIDVSCTLNGKSEVLQGYPMARLLDVLRETGLTGTKEGCGEGECGACSVYLDGRLVNSCLVPLAQVEGSELTTIEGLAEDPEKHPVMHAFAQSGGAQCGICTPGFIMATAKLLEETPNPSEQEVRHALGGNLCRCTGYTKILESALAAAKEGRL